MSSNIIVMFIIVIFAPTYCMLWINTEGKDAHKSLCKKVTVHIHICKWIHSFTKQKYTYRIYSDKLTPDAGFFSLGLTWAISSFSTPSVKPRCSSALISRPSLYHSAEVSFFMLPTWNMGQHKSKAKKKTATVGRRWWMDGCSGTRVQP